MLDDILFERGHIMVRIGDERADYDAIIEDHYFKNVLGLEGEVTDANGSEYVLNQIDSDDNFEIRFIVYEREFETTNGKTVAFEELEVLCTGQVIQEDFQGNGNIQDVLRIDTFDVLRVLDA